MLHTFGDSHARFGFRDIPNIQINDVGPMLCYTFGNQPLDKINIKKFGVKEDDTVIFSLGEIDCRAHIYRFINDTSTFEQIIDCITEKYFKAIQTNIEQYKHIKTVVYNVVPPSDVLLIHSREQYQTQILAKHKTTIPWKGSNEERQKYVIYFNKKLKELCTQYNFIFLDIYEKYCDQNGFLKRELSDYNVHINDSKFIKEFLVENSLI